MPSWMITTLESTAPLCHGVAPRLTQAWTDAIDAAVDELTSTTPEGCFIVMDGVPALLIPGCTDDGQLDLPAIRAAAERVAIAAVGGLG